MRYQNLCHAKLQTASSTALGFCSISIEHVPTEAISQNGTTYSINILYAKPVVGGGGALFLSSWNWFIWQEIRNILCLK